jgi:hypothetical protein
LSQFARKLLCAKQSGLKRQPRHGTSSVPTLMSNINVAIDLNGPPVPNLRNPPSHAVITGWWLRSDADGFIPLCHDPKETVRRQMLIPHADSSWACRYATS